jgi:hypothetical protein
VPKLPATPTPPSGLPRWRYYGVQVAVRGVPPLWAVFGVIFGVGAVTVVTFLAHLSLLWILITVLATLVLSSSVGGYRIWSQLERQPPVPPAAEPTTIEKLRRKLDEAYALDNSAAMDPWEGEIADDPLYKWALETWELLRLF